MSAYKHTSVRVKDATGKTTTVSIPDEMFEQFLRYANGDVELVRRKAREIARKCAKKPGLAFSVQVRLGLQRVLAGHSM